MKTLLVVGKSRSPPGVNVDDEIPTLHSRGRNNDGAAFFVYHAMVQNAALLHIKALAKRFDICVVQPRRLVQSRRGKLQRGGILKGGFEVCLRLEIGWIVNLDVLGGSAAHRRLKKK